MVHAVGAVVPGREDLEGGASRGDPGVRVHLPRRVGLGAASERRLDGRDRRLRLLPPVDEVEQLRGRLAVPELARVGAASVPPRLVEARQVGADGLVVISAGRTSYPLKLLLSLCSEYCDDLSYLRVSSPCSSYRN